MSVLEQLQKLDPNDARDTDDFKNIQENLIQFLKDEPYDTLPKLLQAFADELLQDEDLNELISDEAWAHFLLHSIIMENYNE